MEKQRESGTMKRSKALIHVGKEIVNWLKELDGKKPNIAARNELSLRILNTLESDGMAPPLHPTMGYEMEERNPTGTITYSRKRFNQWESENET